MRLLLLALFITFNAYAEAPEFLCSYRQGKDFYTEIKDKPFKDKTKHCSLSCHVALKCSGFETWNLGVLKEILDVFGPGDADINDLKANRDGIVLAKSKRATTSAECIRECSAIYEN